MQRFKIKNADKIDILYLGTLKQTLYVLYVLAATGSAFVTKSEAASAAAAKYQYYKDTAATSKTAFMSFSAKAKAKTMFTTAAAEK